MHTTLKPRTNFLLLVVWGVLAALFVASLSPVPWFLFGLSALLGGAAGLVQAHSLRSAGAELVAANSLMGVRKALSSSPWGKRYIILFWCSQALLLVLSVWKFSEGTLLLFPALYFGFAFVRELVSLPATFELKSAS
jgi:hypothetical protein